MLGGNTVEITRLHHAEDMEIRVRAGDEITFEIMRDGTAMTVSITVTEDIVIKAEYTERENPVFKVVLDAKEGFFSNGNKILVFEGR